MRKRVALIKLFLLKVTYQMLTSNNKSTSGAVHLWQEIEKNMLRCLEPQGSGLLQGTVAD